MPKIITHSSQMQCTLGASPAKLSVTSQMFHKVNGKLAATENDKAAMTNIPSFGVCKCTSPNPPCVPSPSAWNKVSTLTSINGSKALLKNSTCKCANGGEISFVDTGGNTIADSI